MEKSIYDLICDNLTDGTLPSDFVLPYDDLQNAELWAPGALDGVYMFHMEPNEMDASGRKTLEKAIKIASNGDFQGADWLFAKLTEEHRAVTLPDKLHEYIKKNQRKLDPRNIINTGLWLAVHSKHIECVKVGLELLEIFDTDKADRRKIIWTLGLCEEFSMYAIWNMLNWDDGNARIFELGKKLHSWGRIHAVEMMDPDDDEIRHWLLTEGMVNDVDINYSSPTCWEKSDAESVLFGDPTVEEYKGLAILIKGLIEERVRPGISEIEDADEVLLRFLKLSKKIKPGILEYGVISLIGAWAVSDEEYLRTEVAEACIKILKSRVCKDTVRSALDRGEGFELALMLELPYQKRLLELMRQDFDHYCDRCTLLFDDPKYFEPMLRVFREKLPLADMTGDPVEDPCVGPEYVQYDQLQLLLMGLIGKPLTGMDFVETALRSPVVRTRFWALADLESWVEKKKIPLSELSSELYEVVLKLREKEIDEGCMMSILPLLEGVVNFQDDEEESEDHDEWDDVWQSPSQR